MVYTELTKPSDVPTMVPPAYVPPGLVAILGCRYSVKKKKFSPTTQLSSCDNGVVGLGWF